MSLWKHALSSARTRGPAAETGPTAIACLTALLCLTLTALSPTAAGGATAVGGTPGSRASTRARAAHVVTVDDTAGLHTADPNSTSATIVEEGKATGTLPGTVRAHLAVGVSVVDVGFTIYLHGGTISGQATAKLNPGKGEYASFKGALDVAHGSGRYAHAQGSGQVYGTLNHYSYEAKVQVVGQLHY